MPTLLVAVLGCLLYLEALAAGPATTPSTSQGASATHDAVEAEFQALLARDDAVQAAASEMITNDERGGDPLSAPLRVTLRARLDQKLQPVRDAYIDFLLRHAEHARGHLAFGSFLADIGEDSEALIHDEKARDLDPTNPAAWNNLGGLYARQGQVARAFGCYEEAIRLNTNQASYPHSLGTLICLFPREASEHYRCKASETLPRAVLLYEAAIRLDPENFEYWQDLAETFYGGPSSPPAKPEIRDEWGKKALSAWTNALTRATIDIQREGVYLHMARWHLRLGEKESASKRLSQVTLHALLPLKRELLGALDPSTVQEKPSGASKSEETAETEKDAYKPTNPSPALGLPGHLPLKR